MTEKTNVADEISITIDPEKINNELVKQNITEQALMEMKQNFMTLKITDINDKEGYKKVDEARKLCKNTRILATKICKKGREAAVAEQKAWIAKEKEVVEQISKIEEHLEEQVKLIDDEKAKIKAQKEAEEQERLQLRISKLNKCRMEFNGVEYRLGPELVITAAEVKLMDDFTFNGFYSKVEAEFNQLEALRLEEERKTKEKAEELARKEEELKKQEESIAAQKAEFEQKQKEAQEKAETEAKRVAEEKAKIEEEKRKEIEARFKTRASSLHNLGMSFNGEKFLFHDIVIEKAVIEKNSAEDFQQIIDDVTPKIANKKAELEKVREAELAKAKEEAAEKARIEAEQKAKAEADAKAKAEADAKAAAEREASLKPDREKILVLSAYIKGVTYPELTTEDGKKKLGEIKEQFVRFSNYLDKAAEGLK